MAHKLIPLLFAVLACSGIAHAQDNSTEEINKIKKSSHYLNATGTSSVSEEEASQMAQAILSANVERWLSENTKEDITGYAAKCRENFSTIETRMGKLYRVFAYVKKKDVLPCYEGESIVTDQDFGDVASIETSVESEEAVEIEKPGNAQMYEPVEVGPVIVARDVRKVDDTTETPKETDAVVESEESVVVEPIQLVPVYGGKKDAEEEQKMQTLPTASELRKYLNSLTQRGKQVTTYEVSEMPTRGTAYLIVMDYHGIIRMRIRITDGVARDIATDEEVNVNDALEKYSTGSRICFTIK